MRVCGHCGSNIADNVGHCITCVRWNHNMQVSELKKQLTESERLRKRENEQTAAAIERAREAEAERDRALAGEQKNYREALSLHKRIAELERERDA